MTEQPKERPSGLLRALGGPIQELLLGVVVAVITMIPIVYYGRDYWFRYDDFLIIGDRNLGRIDDWFRPHLGHWLTWTIVLCQTLYHLVGMQYWPIWFIPRLIGAAFVAFVVWRTILARGADRIIAFGTYVALLVLAVSYFQDAFTIANYIVYPALIIAALLVNGVEQPAPRHLIVVGASLFAALTSNGYGTAILAGFIVATLLARRFRRWAPALIPPAVAFVIWYLWYRGQFAHPQHPLSVAFARDALSASFTVLRTTIANTFGLGPLAILAVVGLAAWIAWLAWQRRFDTFDAIMLLSLAFILGLLAWGRTTEGGAENTRYGYTVVLLLVLALVPKLRLPTSRNVRVVAIAVLVAVVVFNAVALRHRLIETGALGRQAQEYARTTAALLRRGEPYNDYSMVGIGVEPVLLKRAVDDGWHPTRSSDPAVVRLVRRRMRFVLDSEQAKQAATARDRVTPSAPGVGADGCLVVQKHAVVPLTVTGPGAFIVDRQVRATWSDRFGNVSVWAGPGTVGLARPKGSTTVSVRGLQPTKICGLAPPG
jgi:hypothetical protein